jgi:capsular polysaccharide biosynthesis protein
LATNVQHNPAARRTEMLPALRRHWLAALIPLVLFVAGAVVLAVKRPARYTTTSVLSVGHVYVSNPVGIPTVIEATQSLAAVYSRAINSGAVIDDTRRRLQASSTRASGSLSATPIPESPLIKVSAESSTPAGAVALANASAAALATYINGQVRDNSASATLAQRYREASLRYRQRLETSDKLARRYADTPTPAKKAARDSAAAATDAALLRRQALSASYQAAVQGGTSSVGVEVFSRAGAATSDRRRMAEILLFVGLVGGIVAGTALALFLAHREQRPRPVA